MNTTNGTLRTEKRGTERRIAIEIVVNVTATRPGPPRGETGSYTALVDGKAVAKVAFDGGLRRKYEARQALFARLEMIDELH